ncbi:MAG TPA: epimerase [Dehalococcoidia bacterium]|nr:epimerase [Dehalococcoidia bacterium]
MAIVKVLVLGGTVFLGRRVVEATLAGGHEVTLFNRGQSNPGLYAGDGRVEHLHGDRDGGLAPLARRRWDVLIDTSGYVPRIVRQSARLLAEAVGRYVFVSSISVYDERRPGIDEQAKIATLADETVEEVGGESYGPLKALCEREVEAALPGRAIGVRAGLIVGADDRSDRFTYWPRRLARGGEVLAPGRPQRPVQIIDARDLAEWMLRLAADGGSGVFNATGPAHTLTMRDALETCRAVAGNAAHFTWTPDAWLLEQGAGPWLELPLWVPENDQFAGFMEVDCRKAIAAGLSFRPLAETVRETLAWDVARPAEERANPRAGMRPEREAELLARWHAGGQP